MRLTAWLAGWPGRGQMLYGIACLDEFLVKNARVTFSTFIGHIFTTDVMRRRLGYVCLCV